MYTVQFDLNTTDALYLFDIIFHIKNSFLNSKENIYLLQHILEGELWTEQKEYYSKEGNKANRLGKHSILHAHIDDNFFLKNVYFSNKVTYKIQIVIGVHVYK